MRDTSLSRGFTLIELLVGVAIAVILLVLAAPTYVTWLSDSQVGNAASGVAEGLRFAQAEAIKRNTSVEFTTGTSEWHVNLVGDAEQLRSGKFTEGAQYAVFTPQPATSTTVTFNSFGQINKANASAPTVPLEDVTVNMSSGTRTLRVLITNGVGGTGIKVCDPALPAPPTDAKGCP